ncbi:MAG: hypothetical protein AD742_12450 [Methylibium sp. NZG]|nr:MAG: hypothetical protein AD742_12450 [Methylibium sp. NZG]
MPWLAPYQPLGGRVARQIVAGRTVVQALNAALPAAVDDAADASATAGPFSDAAAIGSLRERGLRFVEHGAVPAGEAYESFIARTGCVPTREHAHDLFNGLVWLRFGTLKRRLNALHVQQIEAAGVGATRGALRDALTLFDENAALLHAPSVLSDALRRRDWQALFVEHRSVWAGATLTIFGHALLEKLLRPRKPITAHVRLVPGALLAPTTAPTTAPTAAPTAAPTTAPTTAPLDELIAQPHLPLPVLGVPSWWPPNEAGNFYQDAAVFRPPRNSGSPRS